MTSPTFPKSWVWKSSSSWFRVTLSSLNTETPVAIPMFSSRFFSIVTNTWSFWLLQSEDQLLAYSKGAYLEPLHQHLQQLLSRATMNIGNFKGQYNGLDTFFSFNRKQASWNTHFWSFDVYKIWRNINLNLNLIISSSSFRSFLSFNMTTPFIPISFTALEIILPVSLFAEILAISNFLKGWYKFRLLLKFSNYSIYS